METKKAKAARKAIQKSGGPSGLAKLLLGAVYSEGDYLRMQHRISKWRINGVSPRWVLPVEKVTGVPRHELAPDLYPKEAA